METLALTRYRMGRVACRGSAGPPLRPSRARVSPVFKCRVDSGRSGRASSSGVPNEFPPLTMCPRRAANGWWSRRRRGGLSRQDQYVNCRCFVRTSTCRGVSSHACPQGGCRAQRSLPMGRRRRDGVSRNEAYLPLASGRRRQGRSGGARCRDAFLFLCTR